MNVYLVKAAEAADLKMIRDAVREALRDFYRGFELKDMLTAIPESDHEFFLEGPGGILWVRIYDGQADPSDFEELISEARYLLRTMNSKVTLYAFIPRSSPVSRPFPPSLSLPLHPAGGGLGWGVGGALDLHFFEYEFLWASHGGALALKEWPPALSGHESGVEPEESPVQSIPRPRPSFKQAILSRDEITELLEMARHFQVR